jgi:hypothetical protein
MEPGTYPTKAHKKSLSSHATGIDHAFFLRAGGSDEKQQI